MAATIQDMRHIIREIAGIADAQGRNNVVTNTIKRTMDREANEAFSIINGSYHPAALSSTKKNNGLKTRVILIKPVGDHCNLRCSYCYETLRLEHGKEKKMSLDDIRTYLNNFLGKDSDVSDIFLHGGEPLLAGKDFFKEFIRIIQQMGMYGKLTLGIQTNATLLDQEWVDFLKAHDFSIGVSLDGDKEIHDSYRVDHMGRGSYDRVMAGIRLLQENEIPFGIISVVSKDIANLPDAARRILDHHISVGVRYVDVHPAFTPDDTSGSSADCNMSRDQYTQFMTDLAWAWAHSSDPQLRLRCIEDIIQNLSASKSVSCYAAGYCTSILGIDPSGAVSPCTRPFHAEYQFGNAGELTIKQIETQPSYQKFVQDEAAGQQRTTACEWSSLCGYGNCPHERFTNGRQDPTGKHIFCACHDSTDPSNGFPGFYKNLFHLFVTFKAWLLQKERV